MAVDKGPSSNSNASDADGVHLTPADLATVSKRLRANANVPEPTVSPPPPDAGEPADAGSNVALAWRVLSSPRTLLALSFLLALLLLVAASLPQRPSSAELARQLSFASGDVARGLGLVDVLSAWPTLLLLLLFALNAAGIFIARWMAREANGGLVSRASLVVPQSLDEVRGKVAAARIGNRGLTREGGALALLGLVALFIAFVVARGSALDARLELTPGTRTLSEAVVRDGEIFLPRSLPYGLMCERPDPQDPRRAFDCRLGGTRGTEPVQVSLAPGYSSRVGDLELSPLRESLRRFGDDEPIDAVLTRSAVANGTAAVERVRLEPGKTISLRATGQRLTAYPGPDGPLLVVEADGTRPVLMGPASDADHIATATASDLQIGVLAATQLTVAMTSSPEAPLVLGGVLLLALGLLLMALVPHLQLALEATTSGTRVSLSSANRPGLPARTLLKLAAQGLGGGQSFEGAPEAGS